MSAEASVRPAQKVLQLGGFAESYPNPVVELPVDDRETMLRDAPRRDLLQDQFGVVPGAVRWLRWIAQGVEEPPKYGLLSSWGSHSGPVDHEHAVARELCLVSHHLPVVLHHDLIN